MRRAALVMALLTAFAVSCHAQTASPPEKTAITVYNDGFALVKDVRDISLEKGINSVMVEDVSARIDPTSVLFKPLENSVSVSILEQNYQYDLISPENILKKSVGKRVTYTRYDSDGKPHRETGTLLNPPDNGGTVIKNDSGEMVLNPYGEVSVVEMPEGLRPKPTLNWLLRSDSTQTVKSELSYITEGIAWKADYVVLVSEDDTSLDLSGWVTLSNKTGTTYNDASLMLIAGDVRRERDYGLSKMATGRAAESLAIDEQFEEKSFFEYHLYTMARPTTIKDKEMKQLALLQASDASVVKHMIYDPRGSWFNSFYYPGRTSYDPGSGFDTSSNHKINVVLEAVNSKENNMGMPLPKGTVRVYKLDTEGSQQFVGEDSIDHTPKDEKIRLYIGDAFDVTGDYKRDSYRKIAKTVVEEDYEAEIRNHKETAVTVDLMEHVWGDWEIVKSSHDYQKKDARTLVFSVEVPADGKTKVTYTIRTSW